MRACASTFSITHVVKVHELAGDRVEALEDRFLGREDECERLELAHAGGARTRHFIRADATRSASVLRLRLGHDAFGVDAERLDVGRERHGRRDEIVACG